MNFAQFGETQRLRKLIIGRCEGYRATAAYEEIVNEEQRKGLPTEETLKPEFAAFRAALEAEGVEVLLPDFVGKFVYDQLTPRDLGMAIGERFLICNMAKASRRYEAAGLFRHIGGPAAEEPNIIIPDEPRALMEGGDLILDKGVLLVGLSQRTNAAGLAFLERTFGQDFEVLPVHCRSLAEGENVLHLDCTFNPVGERHCLIYPPGFSEVPDFIRDNYEWIAVSKAEQAALATNVLSIDEQTLISRAHPACRRVNEELRQAGLRVIELPFDGAPRTGGAFRCCSLPLVRGDTQKADQEQS